MYIQPLQVCQCYSKRYKIHYNKQSFTNCSFLHTCVKWVKKNIREVSLFTRFRLYDSVVNKDCALAASFSYCIIAQTCSQLPYTPDNKHMIHIYILIVNCLDVLHVNGVGGRGGRGWKLKQFQFLLCTVNFASISSDCLQGKFTEQASEQASKQACSVARLLAQ